MMPLFLLFSTHPPPIHHHLPAMDAHFPTSQNFGILIPSSLGSYYVEDQLI